MKEKDAYSFVFSAPTIVKVLVFIFIASVPFKDAIYEISNGLIGGVFIWLIFKNRDLNFILENKIANTLCILLLISMTVSNYQGSPGIYGWRRQLQFFYRYILLYYSLLYFLEKQYLSIGFVFKAAIVSLGIQALDGLYQYVCGIDLFKHRALIGGRLTGAVHNPNPFGQLMMIGSIALLDLLKTTQIRKDKFIHHLSLLSLFCIFFFCLLNSGSRSSWLGFFVAILCYSILNFRFLLGPKNKYLLVFLILLCSAIFWLNSSYLFQRFSTDNDVGKSYRIQMWQIGWSAFIESPFFGSGIQDSLTVDSIKIGPPHNVYLEIAVYLGITGFLVYAALFSCAIWCAAMMFKKRQFYLLALIGIFTSSFFDHTFITGQIILSVLCLLFACLVFERSEPASAVENALA